MSFISIEFIGFVIISLLFYYIVPKKIQWLILLGASIAFYLVGGAKTVLYLVFTTITTYIAGRLLGKCNKEEKQSKKKKKLIVLVTLLLNFGLLFVFKYWNSVVEMFANFSSENNLKKLELVLPLGI